MVLSHHAIFTLKLPSVLHGEFLLIESFFIFPCESLPSTDILEDSSNNEANDHSAVLPEFDYAGVVVDD